MTESQHPSFDQILDNPTVGESLDSRQRFFIENSPVRGEDRKSVV